MNKIVLCGLCLIASNVYSAVSNGRPNIIVIMADDMGWGDVGFSSPTRASVLTGRHPFRTGVFSANVGILRKREVTLPELLRENGYTTGLFGKWHLGTLTYKEKDANRGSVDNKHLYNPPSWHGFEESFITE